MLCMTSEAYASQVCLSSGSCDRAPRCESDTRRFEHVMVRDSVMAVLTRLASEGRQFYAPFGGEVRGASYTSHVIAYDRANAVWIHYRRAQSRMATPSRFRASTSGSAHSMCWWISISVFVVASAW